MRSRNVVQPSSMEGGGRIRVTACLALPVATSMQQGTLIHAFFEQIQWLDDTPPDEHRLVQVARRLDADQQHIDHALRQFREMLARAEVRSLLSRGFYSHRVQSTGRPLELFVCREQTLMVTSEERLLFGSIDRLVLLKDGQIPVAADIIDFKTDSIRSPDELTDRVAYYRPQLEAYARGVHRMLQIDSTQITARIVFLATGEVVQI